MEPLAEIGIFVVSQIILLAGVVMTLRGDTKVLRVQMDEVREEMKELKNNLLELSKLHGRIERNEERQMAEGKRLDRLETQVEELRHGEGWIFPMPGGPKA